MVGISNGEERSEERLAIWMSEGLYGACVLCMNMNIVRLDEVEISKGIDQSMDHPGKM